MTDEFGCFFLDAAFPVHKPDDDKTDIQKAFELERDRLLYEYPLMYPEYELAFDRFVITPEPFESGDQMALGFIVFRAYKKGGKNVENKRIPKEQWPLWIRFINNDLLVLVVSFLIALFLTLGLIYFWPE